MLVKVIFPHSFSYQQLSSYYFPFLNQLDISTLLKIYLQKVQISQSINTQNLKLMNTLIIITQKLLLKSKRQNFLMKIDFYYFNQHNQIVPQALLINNRWYMKEKQLFSYHFLVIALLAFLNCPDRSDYNLPLSIFAFIIWSHRPHNQKHRILWLILASIICDIIWILTVSIGEWTENTQSNKLRGLTQALSIVNLCYKAILFVYAVISIQNCKDLFTVGAFRRHVLYFQ